MDLGGARNGDNRSMESRLKDVRQQLGRINNHDPECALMEKINVKETILFLVKCCAAGQAHSSLSVEEAKKLMMCPIYSALVGLLAKNKSTGRTYADQKDSCQDVEFSGISYKSKQGTGWIQCSPQMVTALGVIGLKATSAFDVVSFLVCSPDRGGSREGLQIRAGWWYSLVEVVEGTDVVVLGRVKRCFLVREDGCPPCEVVEYERYVQTELRYHECYPVLKAKHTAYASVLACMWNNHVFESANRLCLNTLYISS